MDLKTAFHRAASLIAYADALVIGAGAGMGVDSGLPDFRGANGLWTRRRFSGGRPMDIMEMASPQAFEVDPAFAWGFYGQRLNDYRNAEPHTGFEILKRWGKAKKFGAWVFTSNIDGQFQKAGFDPAFVEECHGSIHHLQCVRPCTDAIWTAETLEPIVDATTMKMTSSLPRCPHCGELARPNVLMFNDDHFVYDRASEQRSQRLKWLSEIETSGARLVAIEIGAGSTLLSVRHFSFLMGRDHGAPLIRINTDDAHVEQDNEEDIGLPMSAAAALSKIDDVVRPKTGDQYHE